MFSFKARTAVAISIALSLVPAALGQQTPPAQTTTPQATASRGSDYVESSGFKGRVFDVKYRDPRSLIDALRPLGSGFKGATISWSDEFKTLSVRDFPENIAAIEEALKRLDRQEVPRPEIQFTIRVLIASSVATAQSEVPAELADVVKQLQSTLKYKSYGLMVSAVHRTKEGPAGVDNSGVAESKLFAIPQPEAPTFYEYRLMNITLDGAGAGTAVNIGNFKFSMRVPLSMGNSVQYQSVGFSSPISLKQGEKVVVGSTTMGDKGLIVVLSASIVQ
jgi:hypothetical protein